MSKPNFKIVLGFLYFLHFKGFSIDYIWNFRDTVAYWGVWGLGWI